MRVRKLSKSLKIWRTLGTYHEDSKGKVSEGYIYTDRGGVNETQVRMVR